MISSLSLVLALTAAGSGITISTSKTAGSGTMTAPPGSTAPPTAGGGVGEPESLVYQMIHFGGFGKGTKTGYWEEAIVYAPDQSKPRPLLVIFHKYGVSHWDGWVNTDFYAEGRRRGWHVVCMLGAAGINFASMESQQNTEVVLDWMMANYNIDPERIYGVGFSMGGGSATSFAARHLDPSKYMFAAIVDHTGGVSLRDTYVREMGPSWPLPQFALDFWYGDGTQGSADMWKLARSSVIDFNPNTYAIDPTRDMARNLTHVPTKITRASQEPAATGYLTMQSDMFAGHLNALGGDVTLDVVPYAGHSWDMLDERKTMKWLGKRRLQMPTSAETLADRDGVFFHFTITQDVPEVFTPFTWNVDLLQNELSITDTANLASLEVDLASTGLSSSAPLSLVLGTADGLADQVTLNGWPAPPTAVMMEGVQSGSWSYNGASQQLQITVPAGASQAWVVQP